MSNRRAKKRPAHSSDESISFEDTNNMQRTRLDENHTDRRLSSSVQHGVRREAKTIATGRRLNGVLTGDPVEDRRRERRRLSSRFARQKCDRKKKEREQWLEQEISRSSQVISQLNSELSRITKENQELEELVRQRTSSCDKNPSQSTDGERDANLNYDETMNGAFDKLSLPTHETYSHTGKQSADDLLPDSINYLICDFGTEQSKGKLNYPKEFEDFLRRHPIDAYTLLHTKMINKL